MGIKTGISWTDATWNATRGCRRVSSGCKNCYAERVAARFSGPGKPYESLAEFKIINGKREPRWTGKGMFVEKHLLDPLRWKEPKRIFVNSMSDLFYEGFTDEQIDMVFAVMALAHWHTFQILTKREDRMLKWFSRARKYSAVTECMAELYVSLPDTARGFPFDEGRAIGVGIRGWPLPNVQLGVSIEDQATADKRIPVLLNTAAVTRIVSYEPALEWADLSSYLMPPASLPGLHLQLSPGSWIVDADGAHVMWRGLDQVIIGGESGPGARPFDVNWAHKLVGQCKHADVACFVKQMGAKPYQNRDSLCDRHRWLLTDPAGADPLEWPERLRVQEYPEARCN